MSLKHAILGFLSYRSATGYELKQAFDKSVQHFWPADQGQIYRTLSQLEKASWAEKELIPQEDRPNRKVYHITDAGKAELHHWLTTPLPSRVSREPFLIQIFMGGLVSDDEMLSLINEEVERIRAENMLLGDVMARWQETAVSAMNRDLFQNLLTLEFGLNMNRAYLTWLESVITRIETKSMIIDF